MSGCLRLLDRISDFASVSLVVEIGVGAGAVAQAARREIAEIDNRVVIEELITPISSCGN